MGRSTISKFITDTARVVGERFGFEARMLAGRGQVMMLPGEVSPYFISDPKRAHSGLTPLGLLGVNVEEFERYWASVREEKYSSGRLTLGMFITNYRQFMDPPVIEDLTEASLEVAATWLGEIYGTMLELPTNFEALDAFVRRGEMIGKPIASYTSPEKFAALKEWLPNERSLCRSAIQH